MTGIRRASVTALLFVAIVSLCASVRPQARRPMAPADILRIANVSDAQISPNGEWVVYTVSTTEGDQNISTLWLVRAVERFGGNPIPGRPPERRRNPEFARNPALVLLPPGWNATT